MKNRSVFAKRQHLKGVHFRGFNKHDVAEKQTNRAEHSKATPSKVLKLKTASVDPIPVEKEPAYLVKPSNEQEVLIASKEMMTERLKTNTVPLVKNEGTMNSLISANVEESAAVNASPSTVNATSQAASAGVLKIVLVTLGIVTSLFGLVLLVAAIAVYDAI